MINLDTATVNVVINTLALQIAKLEDKCACLEEEVISLRDARAAAYDEAKRERSARLRAEDEVVAQVALRHKAEDRASGCPDVEVFANVLFASGLEQPESIIALAFARDKIKAIKCLMAFRKQKGQDYGLRVCKEAMERAFI